MNNNRLKEDNLLKSRPLLIASIIALSTWILVILFVYWVFSPQQYELVEQYSYDENYNTLPIDSFSPEYRAAIYANRVGTVREGYKKYHLLRLALEALPERLETYIALDNLVKSTPEDFPVSDYLNRIRRMKNIVKFRLIDISKNRYLSLDSEKQAKFIDNLDIEFKQEVIDALKRNQDIKFRY